VTEGLLHVVCVTTPSCQEAFDLLKSFWLPELSLASCHSAVSQLRPFYYHYELVRARIGQVPIF